MDWRDIIPQSTDHSYVADAVWDRGINDKEEELTEDQIVDEDPQWTPPMDLWRPASTLGSFSSDPPVDSG